MTDQPLAVVLCWHMHQPDYIDPLTGQSQAPWTYLHAIKDYVDMAAHLEAHPQAKAVVNFSATLLDRLAALSNDLRASERSDGGLRDPLLAALDAAFPQERESRQALVRACLQVNEPRVIDRFPPFRELITIARWAVDQPAALSYLNDTFLGDLLTWYHLAWVGETVRRDDPLVHRLMARERHFTLADREELVALIHRLVAGVIPRYRALADRGQIELSVTPYSHPILPLLLDFESAREAWPECPLPDAAAYPGGEARARWQVNAACEAFATHFGQAPIGCWPAEGGVSAATLRLLDESGFRWAASGQGVLSNSLDVTEPGSDALHRPYRIPGSDIACFFRDDGLSDAIGFDYKDWHGDDAVADLVHRLEHIRAEGGAGRVVPIILDGENAWEHYPENAYYFLGGLYARLANHPRLRLTTFSAALDDAPESVGTLETLVAGSWVYGTFSTWIGEPDKNRAWSLLVEAKRAYDEARPSLDPQRAQDADRRMAACECSDWFWWLGDDNPEVAVRLFERLFRLHLTALYRTLGVRPPEALGHMLARGAGNGAVSTMRRSGP